MSVPEWRSQLPVASSFPYRTRLTAGQVLGFLAFSHGWTWTFYWIAASWGRSTWEPPGTIFFYLGGAGVLLGGVVMSWVTYGVDGLWDLVRRTTDPRRVPGAWWALILLLPPALTIVAAGLAVLLGTTDAPLAVGSGWDAPGSPGALFLAMGFLLLMGPLPEEIGWRGYLLDRLQVRWGALSASLFVGVAWWTWHLPLFLLPGYFETFGGAPTGPWGYLLSLIPGAILYTWIYNHTDRSVLATILFHFVGNLSGEMLDPSRETRLIQNGLEVLLALAVIGCGSARTLRKRGRRPVSARCDG